MGIRIRFSKNDADPDLQHCLSETLFYLRTDTTKRKKGTFAQLYGDSLSDVNATKKNILCAPLPSHIKCQICAKRKLSGFIVPLILYKNYKSDHKSEWVPVPNYRGSIYSLSNFKNTLTFTVKKTPNFLSISPYTQFCFTKGVVYLIFTVHDLKARGQSEKFKVDLN